MAASIGAMGAVAAFLLALDAPAVTGQADSAARRAEVAERGAGVMPFDLDRTRHEFRPTAEGGRQTVVSRDPDDAEQIRRIRSHLQEEADRFRRGDFSDPAFIHGADMPGLAALREGAGRIRVTEGALPDGAWIDYATSDPELVQALHRWFQAQTSDHGAHAHR